MSRQKLLFIGIATICLFLTAVVQAQPTMPPPSVNPSVGSESAMLWQQPAMPTAPQLPNWTQTNQQSTYPYDQVPTGEQTQPVAVNGAAVNSATQPYYAENFLPSGEEAGGYYPGNNRLFVQLDMLFWAVSRPTPTTIGDPASEGIVNVGGNPYFRSNSLDTGFITSDWSLGGRIDIGRMEDDRGWSASVLFYQHSDTLTANGAWFVPADPDGLLAGYQDANNDGIDDDVNGNRIHGRSGEDFGTPDNNNPGTFIAPFDGTPDQGAPIDPGDLVNWLVTFDTFETTNTVDLTGFELMDVHRSANFFPSSLDWFWGVRFLEFRDRFGADGTGTTLGRCVWNVDSDNDILGPQLGLRWAANREWFRFTAEGRFLAGINFQKDRLNGSLGMNTTFGGFNEPVAMEATSFNTLQTNTEFSPVGEWRLEASYYANSWLAFRLGYTGMVIGGVSRSSQKVAYSLPSFALTDAGSTETIFTNGLNIGFEINR
jgi:hypothetical protein